MGKIDLRIPALLLKPKATHLEHIMPLCHQRYHFQDTHYDRGSYEDRDKAEQKFQDRFDP